MSGPAIRLPGILGHFGKKHFEILSERIGSYLIYGASAGIAVTYGTDWKLILQYLPYYNGKFPQDEQ